MSTSFEQSPNWDKSNVQWLRLRAFIRSNGVDITEDEDSKIRVIQSRNPRGRIYSQKELHQMGRDLYPSKQYKIRPTTFPLQVDEVTPEWIREQMERYDTKSKDLINQLALTPATVSIAINGTRPIAPQTKALFYYYFQTKRLGYEMEGTSEEEIMEELAEALAIVKARKAQQASSDISPE